MSCTMNGVVILALLIIVLEYTLFQILFLPFTYPFLADKINKLKMKPN